MSSGMQSSEFLVALIYMALATAVVIFAPAAIDKWLLATGPVAGVFIAGRSYVKGKTNGNGEKATGL